ncbi:hypothetical protein HWB90_gp014 [Mycobacterium phage Fowlmouth]|uniref:Uncharacterized protein n=2 Tax=Fowlmouthvirus fowlmouth TaxID=2845652 RepID=A0A7G8LPQ7_9CAUD|nr:hypothetical protein HWB90_gp014 [Mycobacterium phage Fowlmouth]AYN57964.1 hypothetical protein SEA_FOWLMOUTH_14 [Mycobacterium phage Fowlmouth]QNJ59229.1 hypothetical protein SEA_MRMIYAGI_14 [Mycobacterium phage MrMiyagi]
MATKVQMTWTGISNVEKEINRFEERVKTDITAVFLRSKPLAEQYMRTNAPWQDQTTNARNGLHAEVESDFDTFWELICAHSVFYGIYLETRFSGRYAILMPTILEFGNQIMNQMTRIMAKRGAQD